jgi:hypothetical protein
MTLPELLETLRRAGIELLPDGEALRYGPAGLVSGTLRAALAEHKASLLRILAGRTLTPLARDGAPVPGEWVQTPAGIGELIGWAESEALVQLFGPPGSPAQGPRFVWVPGHRIVGEVEAARA